MPILRNLLHHKSGESKSPESPNSPKFPGSPRTPTSPDLSRTETNTDHLQQCVGCNNVNRLIYLALDQRKSGSHYKGPPVLLHNSFEELDNCAHKCHICRVFRQALVLEQVTFDDVKELHKTPGEVRVRWGETTTDEGITQFFLNVELQGRPERTAAINCNPKGKEVRHLALLPNSLEPGVIDQAKHWLNTCVDTHIGECDNLRWSSENPRLLVEILSPTSVRLCENQEGEYVALSYCWGNMQTLSQAERTEVERGKTLLANLDRRRQPFPMSDLPTTVRDALRIIHAMGLRYAWVDTLCIVQDKPEGVATMHKVYSNALFTLCACATTQATAKLVDKREAWSLRTEPCRLGNFFLDVPDMSLNELRTRSPLAGRAWTLQEERLSPRMLYVTSSRVYWSCAKPHEMELKPTYDGKATSRRDRMRAPSDRSFEMPPAQNFLMACHDGTDDLHEYWLDIVQSYALRSMSVISDRLTALSGLAAKYLSASSGDEYLAGLWANHLAEGLAWRVHQAIAVDGDQLSSQWPSWSWAATPLQTVIETNAGSARSPHFQREADGNNGNAGDAENAISRGERVNRICVTGRLRPFWSLSSRSTEWSTISRMVEGIEKFTFASNPQQDMHAVQLEDGRILSYEGRKRELVGQLDFFPDVHKVKMGQLEVYTLELGVSTALLLAKCGDGSWRRVGVVWHVRGDYFADAQIDIMILR